MSFRLKKLEKARRAFEPITIEPEPSSSQHISSFLMIRAVFEPDGIEPASSRAFTELWSYLVPDRARAEPSFDSSHPYSAYGSILTYVYTLYFEIH